MSQQSKVNQKPGGSASSSSGPDKQTALDLLASWVALAQAAGLTVEQTYSPKNGRFSVRVYEVAIDTDRVVVAGVEE
jgi:hypothetical protein